MYWVTTVFIAVCSGFYIFLHYISVSYNDVRSFGSVAATGYQWVSAMFVQNDKFADLTFDAPVRKMEEARELIRTARRMLSEPGNITAAKDLLTQHRLSAVHTQVWNPFFMLPHTDFWCFPSDWLHSMCVDIVVL